MVRRLPGRRAHRRVSFCRNFQFSGKGRGPRNLIFDHSYPFMQMANCMRLVLPTASFRIHFLSVKITSPATKHEAFATICLSICSYGESASFATLYRFHQSSAFDYSDYLLFQQAFVVCKLQRLPRGRHPRSVLHCMHRQLTDPIINLQRRASFRSNLNIKSDHGNIFSVR